MLPYYLGAGGVNEGGGDGWDVCDPCTLARNEGSKRMLERAPRAARTPYSASELVQGVT